MDKKLKLLIAFLVAIIVLFAILAIWSQREKIARTITAEVRIGNSVEHPDYVGTLTISSVGIEVPLILVEEPGMMQMVVDKTNCAALMKIEIIGDNNDDDYAWVVGDHNYQKFKKLSKCEINDEAAIICADGTVKKFLVTNNFTGHNAGMNGGLLTDDNWNTIMGDNPGGIILYTCRDNPKNVRIVFLQPTE